MFDFFKYRNKLCLIVFFCVSIKFSYAQKHNNTIDSFEHSGYIFELPSLPPNDTLIYHLGFSLAYNKKNNQADWVAYELTKEETIKLVNRKNKFTQDPAIKLNIASNADYKNSGFDRGHLAPAADMAWSEVSMKESFYFSNVSPQVPSFNRGIWKNLEEEVRLWVLRDSSLYIITGPIISDNYSTIGPNQIAVPKYFFKVILDYSLPEIKGIGFIISNTNISGSFYQYSTTINEVEKVTGLDFFPLLPHDEEMQIEDSICIPCWKLSK